MTIALGKETSPRDALTFYEVTSFVRLPFSLETGRQQFRHYVPLAAAAKAVAATVEEIAEVIAAAEWFALVIRSVIIIILAIIMALVGYLETMPIGS